MNGGATVYVIDGAETSRRRICGIAASMGLPSSSFLSTDLFLSQCSGVSRGCLVARPPSRQRQFNVLIDGMAGRKIDVPAIIIADQPATSQTVQLMKRGAVWVLETTFRGSELVAAIREAIELNRSELAERMNRQIILDRMESLSESERAVLQLVVGGQTNKAIARQLEVSVRTVENRRQHIYTKMHVHSIAELVRMVVRVECGDLSPPKPAMAKRGPSGLGTGY